MATEAITVYLKPSPSLLLHSYTLFDLLSLLHSVFEGTTPSLALGGSHRLLLLDGKLETSD